MMGFLPTATSDENYYTLMSSNSYNKNIDRIGISKEDDITFLSSSKVQSSRFTGNDDDQDNAFPVLPFFQEVSKEEYCQAQHKWQQKKQSIEDDPHGIDRGNFHEESDSVLRREFSPPPLPLLPQVASIKAKSSSERSQPLNCPSTTLQRYSSTSTSVSSTPIRLPQTPKGATAAKAGRDEEERILPPDFSPKPWSVVIGRDKKSLEATGNRRLHVIVGWYLDRYAKSRHDKHEKSRIISDIEHTIRSACGSAAFITKDEHGQWRVVASSTAREKISRLLRESLHATYSSSSRHKREARRRRQSRTENHIVSPATTTSSSVDTNSTNI